MVAPRWFIHANVNTHDLAAAQRFYVDGLGLTQVSTTSPTVPQDGKGFCIPSDAITWEGLMLADHRGGKGPMVDLIEWTDPPTVPTPDLGLRKLGLAALQFTVSDVATVAAATGATTHRFGDEDVVVAIDPDGTPAEVRPGPHGVRYAGIRINVSNLERSVPFYEALMGLHALGPVAEVAVDGGSSSFRSVRMGLAVKPEEFVVELTEWTEPVAHGVALPCGNHAGIYRLAAAVDDIAEAHREVRSLVPAAEPAVDVDVGAHFPPVRAMFFPDPDGATLEYIEVRRRDA